MKVYQLIELLEDMEPGADVVIAEQPRWPLEYVVQGVACRRDLIEHQGEDYCARDHYKENDVILCAGDQIGYSDSDLWEVARGRR